MQAHTELEWATFNRHSGISRPSFVIDTLHNGHNASFLLWIDLLTFCQLILIFSSTKLYLFITQSMKDKTVITVQLISYKGKQI